MSNKKDKLNLKGPDALQVQAAASVEILKANSKLIVGLLLILVVSTVGVLAFNYIADSQQEAKQLELSAIDQVYEQEVRSHAEKTEALEKELDDLKLANKGKKSSQQESRIRELEGQLEKARQPDHSDSSEQYRQFYEANPSSPQGMLAGIRYGHFIAEQGQLDKAAEILSTIANNSNDYKVLRVQSSMVLVSVLEDLGKYDDALGQLDSLLNIVGQELRPKVLLSKARVQHLKKDTAGAQKTLDELIGGFGDSQEAEKARSFKALLN